MCFRLAFLFHFFGVICSQGFLLGSVLTRILHTSRRRRRCWLYVEGVILAASMSSV